MAKKKAVAPQPKTEDVLNALVGVMSKLVDRIEKLESGNMPHKPTKQTKNTKKQQKIVEEQPENLFDTMDIKDMFKQDSIIDKKLWKGKQPVARNRDSKATIVKCGSCHNEFEIFNPEAYLNSEYVCNDCIAGKRRA